ncbi:adenylate/guanylate cyclase domain-containing protein [Croceivirga thetidis]|uniref:Adenylate/guanylate cyclase domain-containing protein n=1 Tax=Croceivirga thetidis TaxID=2721623 RepID=A0ABX1GTG4_9FLAO|nr:adenylate/guanylate cyclase domain-containing protein [Croceivirga thetidis]NKI32336.1 adenylate/guanylate cyclase domain-containing protein [Croceivirga thetidis]
MISPKLRWNLGRILPFGIIWLFVNWVFILSDTMALGDNPSPDGTVGFTKEVLVFASVISFLIGLVVGFTELIFVNRLFRRFSLWKTVIGKFLLYGFLFAAILYLAYPVAASLELGVPVTDAAVVEKASFFWGSYAFWSTVIQVSFSLLLCFVYAAISENLGLLVLVNLFTGKYHSPKQEERIFLFLDMYDSTSIAEALGHTRYFEFLQRYYDDMADAIIRTRGEVYQYIGDEIVITWPKHKGLPNMNCIRCFFEMKADLEQKHSKYQADFGAIPKFKGGMHMGTVTTGEVGALKKEIVYTGDVLNTSARIQGLCKELNQEFLISKELYERLAIAEVFKATVLGTHNLRGKQKDIEIYTISEKE